MKEIILTADSVLKGHAGETTSFVNTRHIDGSVADSMEVRSIVGRHDGVEWSRCVCRAVQEVSGRAERKRNGDDGN